MNSRGLLDKKIILIVQNENAPDGLATRGSYNSPTHLSVDTQDSETFTVRDASQCLSSSEFYTVRGAKGEALLQIKGSCGSFNIRSWK